MFVARVITVQNVGFDLAGIMKDKIMIIVNRAFGELGRELIQRQILVLTKKELRDMLNKRRSGRHVNDSISKQLQQRGIVHFPKNMPLDQMRSSC